MGDTSPNIDSNTPSSSSSFSHVVQPESTAVVPNCKAIEKSDKPLLERLKTHYKTMSLIRLNSELHARNDPPHPLKISLDGGPFYPTTYGALNIGLRILLSAALDFGCAAFPEFESLHDEEK
ncbi:hypothetical protein PFISCL1PPCAC_13128, partial [Pristionchus fissidentatus]